MQKCMILMLIIKSYRKLLILILVCILTNPRGEEPIHPDHWMISGKTKVKPADKDVVEASPGGVFLSV